jgi:hypothetical protein
MYLPILIAVNTLFANSLREPAATATRMAFVFCVKQ